MNAIRYFQRTLSVVPFGENIRAPSTGTCAHVEIPQDHGPNGRGVDADYLYYITAVNDGKYIVSIYTGFIYLVICGTGSYPGGFSNCEQTALFYNRSTIYYYITFIRKIKMLQ